MQCKAAEHSLNLVTFKINNMKWNLLTESQPLATENGNWDGLRSEPVLVADYGGTFYIAVMYEGKMDGNEYRDFFSLDDYEISGITHWMYIPSLDCLQR